MQAIIVKKWIVLCALALISVLLLSFLINFFLPDHGILVDLIFYAMSGVIIAGLGAVVFRR